MYGGGGGRVMRFFIKYRKKGYATKIVKELQSRFKTVAPIGVIPSSQKFWDKFNMNDALGKEK